ncbi:MAG: ribonuclease HII [Actinomycetota bacterium]|nr:ribonuclease HII [Actinomycetota bacterium]
MATGKVQSAEIERTPSELMFGEKNRSTLAYSIKEINEMLKVPKVDPEFVIQLASDPRVTVRKIAFRILRRGGNLFRNENIFRIDGIELIAGADEAGRGSLAGPLVAAAVMFSPRAMIEEIDDSKKLTPLMREKLYNEITKRAVSISVTFIDPSLIDRWGIQTMNMKALSDAINGLDQECDCVICDYYLPCGLGVPAFGIPKADSTFQSVAAASIVAKVERDRFMRSLHAKYPKYNFYRNKGYASREHLEALRAFGPTRFHRFTYRGVQSFQERL